MAKIGFIGAGTVGTALAVRMSQRGYSVVSVASHSRASAQRLASQVSGCRDYASGDEVARTADLVFITTPDGAIGLVAAEVPWRRGQAIVHCSGADSLDILEPARRRGAQVGAFHPLQTFASVAQAIKNIPGSTFALEAEEPLLSTLKSLAEALEGQWVVLGAGDKVLYHASAVMACNYLVTLMKMATDLWQTFGVSPREATQALMPLLRGTLNNLERVGLPNCLTGPVARGDLGTIRKHLEALEKKAPYLLPAYRELGLQTIPVALGKGRIDEAKAQEMRALLDVREAIATS
ncbi:MAG: DUF2520 domain-containing protein [Chloroflexi bacterium]|nr:DUF2520 domain-containing protein [Chloroflexota bacterium]